MIVTFVHIWVKKANVADFLAATLENHENSIEEPGNLRFDVLRDADDPCKFVLYEAFESEEAIQAHKETAHYRKWRDTVADWMAKPRQGFKHVIVYPEDRTLW